MSPHHLVSTRRGKIDAAYTDALTDLPGVTHPTGLAGVEHGRFCTHF
ncbi:hypothetical protein [Streptomyces pseudogriseolus]